LPGSPTFPSFDEAKSQFRTLLASTRNGAAHEQPPRFRLEDVVRATPELNVANRPRPVVRVWDDVQRTADAARGASKRLSTLFLIKDRPKIFGAGQPYSVRTDPGSLLRTNRVGPSLARAHSFGLLCRPCSRGNLTTCSSTSVLASARPEHVDFCRQHSALIAATLLTVSLSAVQA
jgi:hypothetical protein